MSKSSGTVVSSKRNRPMRNVTKKVNPRHGNYVLSMPRKDRKRLPSNKTKKEMQVPSRKVSKHQSAYRREHEFKPVVRDAVRTSSIMTRQTAITLDLISALDQQFSNRYRACLKIEPALNRQLVSFQANKTRPSYRWYKFKEAFSASLVEYLLNRYQVADGAVLDPFAGIGTTLFAAAGIGLDADGIELLPIGQEVITGRLQIKGHGLSEDDCQIIKRWIEQHPWRDTPSLNRLPVLRITDGAYSHDTTRIIEQYICAMSQTSESIQAVLKLGLLSILESVSYTRKDGQYLRWDARSGRQQGTKPFDKGPILTFDKAIGAKLHEILRDVSTNEVSDTLFPSVSSQGNVRLLKGSVLDVLPTLLPNHYSAIVTSPPYCNRYDYTRTYALELALLGINEQGLSALRQKMLSCTVENREKDLLKINPNWQPAITAANRQDLLQTILQYLEEQKAQGKLNNNGIPRMIRGYFYEMACVIFECARVLKSNAPMYMVNDNVRYAGASISVDLILSDIAEQLGFHTEKIMVLPNGKGNSSQQMGRHGREVLRKCVYVWRKIK
jgi:DNA modification methylase